MSIDKQKNALKIMNLKECFQLVEHRRNKKLGKQGVIYFCNCTKKKST